ncbi:hypothetical protein ID866_3646 [Astraeus odoratus]|nr:hypothetical protein ID866_3646 [Astraeus odoratus]
MDQSASSTSFHNLKDPNTLNFQRPVNRRLILASYWIVIFLAIPFWWRLTSIERKGLPSTRVHSQLERRPIFPVHVQVDPSSFRERAPILATDLNKLLARSTRVSSTWQNLDIHVDASHNEGAVLQFRLAVMFQCAIQQPRYLTLSEEDASSAVRVADLLTALLAPETSSPVQRVAQYAKRYRLAFTLLNEDAASAQLISVPPLPSGMVVDDSSILTDWQLDSLLRNRALENIIGSQQTLYSIVKLVEQIGNMPVDETVKGDVQNALTALDQAYRSTPGPPVTALQWSSEALSQASHAFFNPGMLALLYFPAEHKYAVYTPLFASIAVPLIVALGRELYAWRKEYRTATKSFIQTEPPPSIGLWLAAVRLPIMSAAKINVDGMMLFEQPFARVPYENYRKVFRASQRNIERELANIQSVSANLRKYSKRNEESLEEAAKAVDGMIARVENLKRKVRSFVMPLMTPV